MGLKCMHFLEEFFNKYTVRPLHQSVPHLRVQPKVDAKQCFQSLAGNLQMWRAHYALFYSMLRKRFEYPGILVSAGVLKRIARRQPRTIVSFGKVQSNTQIFNCMRVQGSTVSAWMIPKFQKVSRIKKLIYSSMRKKKSEETWCSLFHLFSSHQSYSPGMWQISPSYSQY